MTFHRRYSTSLEAKLNKIDKVLREKAEKAAGAPQSQSNEVYQTFLKILDMLWQIQKHMQQTESRLNAQEALTAK